MAEAATIETPSGKSPATENFPVGSALLPARLRPHVACFYDFARAIDDIADNADLSPEQKVARLEGFEQALLGADPGPGYEKATALYRSLRETNITARHGQDLISAFKQDAVQTRYKDWAELMHYCDRSAAPVGRYLLDLHGEDPAENLKGYAASDALCNALQVINHLQDCADDLAEMDRVYLPQDWLTAADTETSALTAQKTSPELRQVMDQCIAGTWALLDTAQSLPGALRSTRLSMESAVIIKIARKLTKRLSKEDPIATRVKLRKTQLASCALTGVLWGLFS